MKIETYTQRILSINDPRNKDTMTHTNMVVGRQLSQESHLTNNRIDLYYQVEKKNI
jgi:hypothetical protein